MTESLVPSKHRSLKTSMLKKSSNRRQVLKSAAVAVGAVGLSPLAMIGAAQAEPVPQPKPTRGIQGLVAPELDVSHWIDGDGNPTSAFSVAEHRGKWVYLKCFQEWCPACHSVGFPNLQKLKAAFPDDSKIVAAVIQTTFEGHAINNAEALRKNQLRYDLDLPFGHDPGNSELSHKDPDHYPSTMRSYRTGGTPWVTLIDPNGVVAFDGFHINIEQLISYLQENT
jgi:thiol-disulfide isomerase/thioredoxin